MAIHKVLGIETEYGIIVRNAPEQNLIAASSLLVNAYVSEVVRAGTGPLIGWDFGDEMLANDARRSSSTCSRLRWKLTWSTPC